MISAIKPYDLAQPYFVGMPHFPTHSPFLYGLTKVHGEIPLPDGGSSAADVITMGGHAGTHMDALNHFSCAGKLYDGRDVVEVQSYGGGIRHLSIDTVAPIARRGVLLDVAGLLGVNALDADMVITPEHLEPVQSRYSGRGCGVDSYRLGKVLSRPCEIRLNVADAGGGTRGREMAE